MGVAVWVYINSSELKKAIEKLKKDIKDYGFKLFYLEGLLEVLSLLRLIFHYRSDNHLVDDIKNERYKLKPEDIKKMIKKFYKERLYEFYYEEVEKFKSNQTKDLFKLVIDFFLHNLEYLFGIESVSEPYFYDISFILSEEYNQLLEEEGFIPINEAIEMIIIEYSKLKKEKKLKDLND